MIIRILSFCQLLAMPRSVPDYAQPTVVVPACKPAIGGSGRSIVSLRFSGKAKACYVINFWELGCGSVGRELAYH